MSAPIARLTYLVSLAVFVMASCSTEPTSSSDSGDKTDIAIIKKIEHDYWRALEPDVEINVTVLGDTAGVYFNIGLGPGTSVYRRIAGSWKHLASYGTVPGPCQFTQVGIASLLAETIVDKMERTMVYHLDDNPRTPSCVPLPVAKRAAHEK